MLKYVHIADWIRRRIADGVIAAGERLPTEHDLCGQFGVSRQTVRSALKSLEAEGAIARRQGSGSFACPPRDAQKAETLRIGVISTYIDDYIFPGIIRGMETVLHANGYVMQLVCTYNRVENERQLLRYFLSNPVDGLIVEPTKSGLPNPNLSLYQKLGERKTPVVFFDAYYPGCAIPYVALDDRMAGKLATGRLLAAGHTRLAGIFQGDDIQGHLRYAGFAQALTERDIDLDAGRTLWYASEDIPGLFSDAARVLGRLQGATAVFCYNDGIALRLIEFLQARGIRVPEALSVISVDDSAQAAYGTPKLTTVRHPKERLGEMAAGNLLARMRDPAFDANHLFPPALVERDTVMPCQR